MYNYLPVVPRHHDIRIRCCSPCRLLVRSMQEKLCCRAALLEGGSFGGRLGIAVDALWALGPGAWRCDDIIIIIIVLSL